MIYLPNASSQWLLDWILSYWPETVIVGVLCAWLGYLIGKYTGFAPRRKR
jgi:hypothetical protein